VLFPKGEQIEQLKQTPLLARSGVQYHWHNAGYRNFDDFLERFKSKRRHQIRRERRELDKQGLYIDVRSGSDLDSECVDFAYEFYVSTINKYLWGRQYLCRAFFEEVMSAMPEHVLLFLAREKSSKRPIAGAFNLVGGDAMFGRYWGTYEERPYLHFNVCYYAGIEECIRRGLSLFEPGAGGEHKVPRGFEPTLTHSFHHISHPGLRGAIVKYLAMERDWVDQELAGREILKPPSAD
jgi:predicted N-acyltransferase